MKTAEHKLSVETFLLGMRDCQIDLSSEAGADTKLKQAGLEVHRLKELAGTDNVLRGDREMAALFALVDSFDRDGSRRTLLATRGSQPTIAGRMLSALSSQRQRLHTLHRRDFTRSHLLGAFDITTLPHKDRARLAELGVDMEALHRLATGSGYILGEESLARLFVLIDAVDRNGSSHSVTVGISTAPSSTLVKEHLGTLESANETAEKRSPAGEALDILETLWAPFEQPFTDYRNAELALRDAEVPRTYVDVPHVGQTDPKGCFDAARTMLQRADPKTAQQLDGPEMALMMARAENPTGEVAGFAADFRHGRAYIDACLDQSRGVLVGVSHSRRRINHDRMTDHFIVITGRSTDKDGHVVYQYNDPATSGEHRNGHLYVDRNTNLLFRPPLSNRRHSFFTRTYQVTQVRTFRDIPPTSSVDPLNNRK